jgi:hypothetical protein
LCPYSVPLGAQKYASLTGEIIVITSVSEMHYSIHNLFWVSQ